MNEGEAEVLGIKLKDYPADEIQYLPWTAVMHLTDKEKEYLLSRVQQKL